MHAVIGLDDRHGAILDGPDAGGSSARSGTVRTQPSRGDPVLAGSRAARPIGRPPSPRGIG